MAVKMIPFYGLSSCLYCYSSVADAAQKTEETTAATNTFPKFSKSIIKNRNQKKERLFYERFISE